MLNDCLVDPRRLELLLELSRLGSMREVGEAMHVTTSTVSQQIAALAREAGTALVEPDGRRVRLTPAGRRLAGHAATILATIEAARRDLDPAAPPAGTVRVAAFASAFRQVLLPVARILAGRQPEVRLHLLEQEPAEALGLLAADEVDLVLTYDYNLAPATLGRGPHSQQWQSRPLGPTPWSLGTPSGPGPRGTAVDVFRRYRDQPWIVNSRNTADEEVIRVVASLAGFEPRITQRADSLDLVQDMILAGLGVGLLPASRSVRGVSLRRLRQPEVIQRSYAVTRRGHAAWPPLALVLRLLAEVTGQLRSARGLSQGSPCRRRWSARPSRGPRPRQRRWRCGPRTSARR
jgi:DNA-binding transcriptional LysR family regulator